jgi:PAS domain S-box-containing protein
MSLRELGTLLFRTSAYEQAPRFRAALRDVAHTGLQWAGVIGLVGIFLHASVGVFVLGYTPVWTYTHVTPEGAHLVGITVAAVVAVSILLIALARTRCTLRTARLVMAVAVFGASTIVAFDGAVDGAIITDYVIIMYVIGVATVPFRPWEVIGMGTGLVGMVYAFSVPGLPWTPVGTLPQSATQLVFVATAAVLLTGTSAVLYLRHHKRVEVQATLTESQGLLRQAEQIAEVGGWRFDPKTSELTWTDQTRRIHEVPLDYEPDVETALAFYPPEARSTLKEALQRCLRAGEDYDLELPMRTARGNRRWVRTRGVRRKKPGQSSFWLQGAIQDITERHDMERKLREREAWIRSINQNVSEAIYRSTPDAGLVYANQAMADLFGYDDPEAICAVSSETLYADPDERERLTRQLHEEGRIDREEVTFQRRDGSTFIGRLSSSVVRDDDAIQYYDGVISDITERKRREERLREAKEEAERAERLKAAFLANFSHEVRTPLTSMVGFAEVLAEEVEGESERFARLIRQSGNRLKRTFNAVLQLSRLEAEGLDLPQEPVDLAREVEETVTMMKSQAEQRNITLTLDAESNITGRYAPEALDRILENLVGNALKYTPEGGRVTVRVQSAEAPGPAGDGAAPESSPPLETNAAAETGSSSPPAPATKNNGQEKDAREASGPGRWCKIEIEDNGPGIAEDMQEHLFEPFARGRDETSQEEGTGLGLAITHRFVEAMNGCIELDTAAGEGTRFRVLLPPDPDRANRA